MNSTSTAWPTKPGWYWVRDGDRELEVARVLSVNSTSASGKSVIYGVAGAPAFKSEWPNLRWLERISEPPAAGAEACWHIMDTRHRYRAERSNEDEGVSEFRWCHDCSKKEAAER